MIENENDAVSKSASNDLKLLHIVGMGKTNIQPNSKPIWKSFEGRILKWKIFFLNSILAKKYLIQNLC